MHDIIRRVSFFVCLTIGEMILINIILKKSQQQTTSLFKCMLRSV